VTELDLRCDHFMRATPDIETANQQVTRLGLRPSPPSPAADTGARYTVVTLGSHATDNIMFVEYMTHDDRARAAADWRMDDIFALLDAGGGMKALTFSTRDLDAAKAVLGEQPGGYRESITHLHDGQTVTTLNLGYVDVAGCPIGLIWYPQSFQDTLAGAPAVQHDFPLRRVDHMAVVPPDLDAATRYWCDVLGLRQLDDVDGPGFLIRRLQVGDMVIELLSSTRPDGPLAATPPGLMSVLACEVGDVAASVELARSRGFHPPDPAPGVLPGTLVSTIPGEETSGIVYQLLEYVSQ
jgi:catechol 2,3-dioxygenase-like lactoylglutathione lyase family enzyme